MPRATRARSPVMKWVATLVAVLLAGAWAGTSVVSVVYKPKVGTTYIVGSGLFTIAHEPFMTEELPDLIFPMGWSLSRHSFEMSYRPYMYLNGAGAWEATEIALWPFVVLAVGGALWFWWRDAMLRRRERMGACVQCGYDRVGLAEDAACPECGRVRARIE